MATPITVAATHATDRPGHNDESDIIMPKRLNVYHRVAVAGGAPTPPRCQAAPLCWRFPSTRLRVGH